MAENRPSWERATCPRMHCGCVLVRNKRILSTGYNGSLPGEPHCEDVGCYIVDDHCIRTTHAEMNALLQCSIHGISTEGATAYVTNMPCTNCAKALITAGIVEVVIFSEYHNTQAEEFFKNSNINLVRLKMPDSLINYDIDNYSSVKK